MSAGINIEQHRRAPEYEPRLVVSVRREDDCWEVEFDCRHIATFVAPVEKGNRFYCSRCIDELVERHRAERSGGLDES